MIAVVTKLLNRKKRRKKVLNEVIKKQQNFEDFLPHLMNLEKLNENLNEVIKRQQNFEDFLPYLINLEKIEKNKSYVREIQIFYARILKSFDEFCHKYNIPYYIHGGTLIGAIRHKGFIPWDDDVDIMMSREDYKRFASYFNKNIPRLNSITNGYLFTIKSCGTGYIDDASKRLRFSEIHNSLPCLEIDILLYDTIKVIDSKFEAFKIQLEKAKSLLSDLKLTSVDAYYQKVEQLTNQFFIKTDEWITGEGKVREYNVYGLEHWKPNMSYPRVIDKCSDIFPLTKLCFEGQELSVPKNYKAVVFNYYGNIYTLPKGGPYKVRKFVEYEWTKLLEDINYFYSSGVFTRLNIE